MMQETKCNGPLLTHSLAKVLGMEGLPVLSIVLDSECGRQPSVTIRRRLTAKECEAVAKALRGTEEQP